MLKRISWEEYALKIAEVAKLRSEDPYLQVGACALGYNNQVISIGYNGAPSGIEIDWSDRDERRKRVLHAELNCLRMCLPGQVALLAVSTMPCSECLKSLGAYNVPRVVFRHFYDKDNFGFQLAKEFNIEVKQINE